VGVGEGALYYHERIYMLRRELGAIVRCSYTYVAARQAPSGVERQVSAAVGTEGGGP
jgi:hypothetical protein